MCDTGCDNGTVTVNNGAYKARSWNNLDFLIPKDEQCGIFQNRGDGLLVGNETCFATITSNLTEKCSSYLYDYSNYPVTAASEVSKNLIQNTN